MLRGIFPKLLGLTMATVLPFAALAAGFLWDQWQNDQSNALRGALIKAQIVASEIDAQIAALGALLAGLSQGVSTHPADAARNDEKLRELKAELPQSLTDISNILLFKPDGHNIGTSMHGDAKRIFVGDRDYFKAVLAGDRLAVGEPVQGRGTGQWVIGVARAIHDDHGSLAAILVIGIHATHFQHALNLGDLPAGSVMRVISPAGTIVARSANAESRVGQIAMAFPPGAHADVKWRDGVARITGTADTSLVPWTVSVGFPSDAGLENVRSRLVWGMFVSALALLTALALAWFLAARLSRPLRQLTADAKALTAGDLAHRTNVRASGEVDVLARAFNTMVDSLEQRHKELDLAQKASSIEAAERRRVQELERQSKEVLAAIIDTSPVGIVCTDVERRTTLWSRAAERIYGYTAEETLGDSTRILPPGQTEHSASLLRRALRGETVRHVETKRRRKDGTIIDVEVSASALYAPDGSVRGIAWAHNDVTRRKEAERQLAQSQKMEAIGQLTGGIAHDLNNLLLVIIGNLDLLNEKHSSDPDTEELIRASLAAATSGAELANGLLGFSRKQALQPELIETKSLVLDQIGFLKRLLGPTIAVTTELADDTFPVRADPTQLRCALMNLVVNARDAMPGGGTLTVRTYNTALLETDSPDGVALQAGDYAVIEVSDTGVGISPDNVQRIFEPFFTTKDVGKGTGLGLSMVFGFFQQSKGKVGVESEVGRGTTFRAYLPRAEEVPLPSLQPAASPPARRGRERILVVDDDTLVRKVVVRHLAALGYDTIEANDAAEALDIAARNESFDILFSDVVMPGNLSGVELAAALHEKRPALKVLLTSGYPDLKERHESFMDFAMIKKPYRRGDLQAALCALLGKEQIAA